MRRSLRIAGAVAATCALVAGPAYAASNNDNSSKLQRAVTLEGVRSHQQAFQGIADLAGGNRFAGLGRARELGRVRRPRARGRRLLANVSSVHLRRLLRGDPVGARAGVAHGHDLCERDRLPRDVLLRQRGRERSGRDARAATCAAATPPTGRLPHRQIALVQRGTPAGFPGSLHLPAQGRQRDRRGRQRGARLQQRRRRGQRDARRHGPERRPCARADQGARRVASGADGRRPRGDARHDEHGLTAARHRQRARRNEGRRPRQRGHDRRPPRLGDGGAGNQRQRLGLGRGTRGRAADGEGQAEQQGAVRLVERRGVWTRWRHALGREPVGGAARQDRALPQLRHGRLAELRAVRLRRGQLDRPGLGRAPPDQT